MTRHDEHLSRFTKFAVLVSLFTSAITSHAFAQEPYQRRVRKFAMPELGIANLAGLAFSPAANALIVAPSPGHAELIFVTFAGELDGAVTVATAIPDPFNVAFDGKSNSLLFFDASVEELVEIKARPNGRPLSSPGAITRFSARTFGVKEAKGMTFDPATGNLFMLVVPAQHAEPRIVRIVPDPRDRFVGPGISNIVLNSLQGSELRGIAFNPNDGHLYIMSPAEQKLYEVTQAGEVLTTRDISSLAFSNVQNMVFAPSGDQTDDPAVMSLYIADSGQSSSMQKPGSARVSSAPGLGDVTELSLTQPAVQDLSALTVQASLVRTVLTSQWSPPSPDPSGIAYIPSSNSLIVSDGEVEEMSLFRGVNVWQTTLSGRQIEEFSSTSFSDEPAGLAFNPRNRHLFICDDTGSKSVYEVDPGRDGLYGTTDDVITSFSTSDFGNSDPEGIAYDSFRGHLFIADGDNAEVYEVNPGANGVFDGVPPLGDDAVAHFDTSILGLQDPEGVEFNPDEGTLYIVSRDNDDVFVVETTRNGTAVSAIDIAFLKAKKPAGLAYAPSSINPAERSLYIVDRGVDNDNHHSENDGKIYEIALGRKTPGIVIDDVVVTEGNAGAVNTEFTVSLSGISEQTVTVDYATSDGSAKAGSDYVASSGRIIFPPGETSQPIIVSVNGDRMDEPDETFLVKLSNAVNANLGDDEGIATITNDDGPDPVAVSFQDGVNGYNSMRDASLFSDTPGANYGSSTRLKIDGSPRRSAVLFWNMTSIPPGSTIKAVDMTINVTNTSGATYLLYDLKRPWIENEATWNEYASDQNWEVAGGEGPGDRGPFALGRIEGASLGPTTISLNAIGVAVVQSWVDNPAANHGFIILDYINAGDGLDFSSRENGTAAERPKLTVTYEYTGPVTRVKSPEFPRESRLQQNYPNPFNPTTRFSYSIREPGFVSLKIYDMLGKEIQTLINEFQAAGAYSVELDVNKLSSGTYFYTLRIGDDFEETRRMLFLR